MIFITENYRGQLYNSIVFFLLLLFELFCKGFEHLTMLFCFFQLCFVHIYDYSFMQKFFLNLFNGCLQWVTSQMGDILTYDCYKSKYMVVPIEVVGM